MRVSPHQGTREAAFMFGVGEENTYEFLGLWRKNFLHHHLSKDRLKKDAGLTQAFLPATVLYLRGRERVIHTQGRATAKRCGEGRQKNTETEEALVACMLFCSRDGNE